MILIPKDSDDPAVPDAYARVCDDIIQFAQCDPLIQFTPIQGAFGGATAAVGYYGRVDYDLDPTRPYARSQYYLATLAGDAAIFIIHGVGSTFHLPFDPHPVTMRAYRGGVTEVQTTDETWADTWYDVSDTVRWYLLRNEAGQTIWSPRSVILYHELAHAYSDSRSGVVGTTVSLDEGQLDAITEENVFRRQLNLPERSTDPNVHGGEGTPQVGGTTFQRCQGTGFHLLQILEENCLIATASTGSPESPIVRRLHKAKTHYQDLSSWTASGVEQAHALYRQFSPLVVRDMRADPALASAIRLYAVLPLPQFIDLIDQYVADPNSDDIPTSLDEYVSAYTADLVDANVCATSLRAAAEAAADAGRRLVCNPGPFPGPQSRRMPEDLFGYLASMIASTGFDTSAYGWGLSGLALFLRQAAERLTDGTTLGRSFVADLDSWLAQLPLPTGAELEISEASEELTLLSKRFFTATATRELFAAHLLAQWPSDSRLELKSVLSNLDYVETLCAD
jgi:hypothetical protein